MSLIIETIEQFFNNEINEKEFELKLLEISNIYLNDGDYQYFLEKLHDPLLCINKNINADNLLMSDNFLKKMYNKYSNKIY